MIRKVVSRGARKLGKFSKKASKGLASRAGGKVKAGGQHAKKSIFPSGKKSTSSKFASKAGKLGAKSLWLAGKWGTKGLWHLTKAFPHGTITALCIVLLLILAVAIFIILAAYGTFSPGQLAANRTDDIPGGPWTAHTSDVPEQYKQLYIDASIEHNVPWQILVAWGDVATNHGKRSPYDCIWRVDPDSTAAWSEDMKDAFGENTIVYEYIKSKNLRPPYGNETEPQEYPLNPVGWSPYSSQANCANGGSASGWLYQWCPEISNLPDDSPDPPIAPNILYNSPLTPYEKREGRTVRYVDNFHPYLPVIGKNRFTANPLGIAEECRLPAPTSTNTINDGSAIAWYPEGPGTQSYFTRSWRVKWIGNTTKDYCGPMLLQPSATGVSCRELQSASRSINIVAETISVVLDSMNYDTKCQAVEGSELCSLEGQLTAYDNSLIHPPPILSADNHIPELLRRSTLYYPGYWGRIVAETLILLRSDGFHKRSFVERITGSNQKHEVGLLNRSDHYNALMMGGINCENRGGPWAGGDGGWKTPQDIYHSETRTYIPGIDEFTAALVCELDATGPGTYFDWRAGGLPNEGAASSKLASSLWAKDLMDASWAWSQWGTKNGRNGCVNAGRISDSAALTYQYSGIYIPFPPMEANGSRPYSMCDMHFSQNRVFGANPTEEWEGLMPVIDDLYGKCRTSGNYVHCAPLERYLISMFPFTFDRDEVDTGEIIDEGYIKDFNEEKKYTPLAAIPDYNPHRAFKGQSDNVYKFPWAGGVDANEWLWKIIEWCGFSTKGRLDDEIIPNDKSSEFSDEITESQKAEAKKTLACVLYLSAAVLDNDSSYKEKIIEAADELLDDTKSDDFTCWYRTEHFGKSGEGTDSDQIKCVPLQESAADIFSTYTSLCVNDHIPGTSNTIQFYEVNKYPCNHKTDANNKIETKYHKEEIRAGDEVDMINAAWYVRALHAGVAPWPNDSMFPEGSRWEEALANIIASRDLSDFTTDNNDNHTDNYIGRKPDIHEPPEIAAIESRYAELSDEIDMKRTSVYEAGAAAAAIQYLGWGGFANSVKTYSPSNSSHKCGDVEHNFQAKVASDYSENITTRITNREEKDTLTAKIIYKVHIRDKVSTENGICVPKIGGLDPANKGFTGVVNGEDFGDKWSSLFGDWGNGGKQIEFVPAFSYGAETSAELAKDINLEFPDSVDSEAIKKAQKSLEPKTEDLMKVFWNMSSSKILDESTEFTEHFRLELAEIIFQRPEYKIASGEKLTTKEINEIRQAAANSPPERNSLSLSVTPDCRFVSEVGDISASIDDLWWECIWNVETEISFDLPDEYDSDELENIVIIITDDNPYVLLQIPYESQKGETKLGYCYVLSGDDSEANDDFDRCFRAMVGDGVGECGQRVLGTKIKEMHLKLNGNDTEASTAGSQCDFSKYRNFTPSGNTDCGSAYRWKNRGAVNTISVNSTNICKVIETVPWMARGWNRPSPWDEGASNSYGFAFHRKSIFETATWPISSSKTSLFTYRGNLICDPSTSEGSLFWGRIEKYGNPASIIPSIENTRSGLGAIRRNCSSDGSDITDRPLIPSIAYPSVSHISPHRWVGWSDQVFTEEKANKCNLGGSLEYERNETCWHAGLEIAHRARWMAGGIQAEDGPPVILPHDCHPDYRGSVSSQPQLVPTNSPESCILGDSGMEIYATQPWISDRHFCKGAQDGRYHDGIYLTRKNIADGEDEKIKVKNKFVDCGYGKDVEKPEHQLSLRENGVTCINREMGFIPSGDVCRRASAMYDAADSNGVTLIATSHTTPQQQLNKRKTNCSGNGITEQKLLYDKTIKCSAPTALPRSRYSWHEMGSALDFTVSGDRNKCPDAKFWKMLVCENDADFFWLFLNAYRFGFQNLPSEPWHWSPMGA